MSTETHSLALAQRYLEVGQPRRTLDTLEHMDGAQVESPDAWRLRAAAFYGLEEHDRAASAARQGLERAPDWMPLLFLLSVSEDARGNLGEAERAILVALEQDPQDAELLAFYAQLLLRGGQVEKAERVIDQAAELAPDSPDVLRSRISLSYIQGDDKAGARYSEQLLALDPEDATGHRLLGAFKWQTAGAGDAVGHLMEAARRDPGDRHAVEAAREARCATHPLMRPLWPVDRFGVATTWVAAVGTLFALRAAGLSAVAGPLGLLWLSYCAYSWIIPAWVRRRVERELP